MVNLAGNIDVCTGCEIHLNGALCPDDCKVYQDLRADYEYDRMMEAKDDR